MVKKTTGKWWMCVDFTYLNKACPNDSFSLPKTDILVDSTMGFEFFSSLDANSGYHQIPMHLDDEEETSFITKWGTYYYKVMSLILKKWWATYQQMVNTVFKHKMRIIEGYVDDILVINMKFEKHLLDREDVFFMPNQY